MTPPRIAQVAERDVEVELVGFGAAARNKGSFSWSVGEGFVRLRQGR